MPQTPPACMHVRGDFEQPVLLLTRESSDLPKRPRDEYRAVLEQKVQRRHLQRVIV